ncbi:MAG: glucose 1-dehydrogenase [Litorilinea sp.]
MSNLQDRVAIVTGGGRGIGGATARRLAAAGARVYVADKDGAAAAENAARILDAGGSAVAAAVDVSEHDQYAAMVENAAAQWGRLDIIVNNAYGRHEPDGSALTVTDSAFDYGLTIMAKTILWSARYGVPHLRAHGHGSIVNIASVHGFLYAPGSLVYETGKAAVIAMTKQMAIDLGPLGVRVNAICPGHIVTERQAEHWQKNPSHHKMLEQNYPLRHTGTPDDIAHAINFLSTDEARFITGHIMVVDGGMTVQLQENFGNHMGHFMRAHPDTQLPPQQLDF